jgi:hypothetical protein
VKNANAAVISLLSAIPPTFHVVDFYSFGLTGGITINLCNGDFDALGPPPSAFASATTSGFTTQYYCGSINSGYPKIDLKQSKVQGKWSRGLDSDEWKVALLPTVQDPFTGAYTYPDVIGGTPWFQGIDAGFFDSASISVARAYYASPPTPAQIIAGSVAARTCVGTILIFQGLVGAVDCNETICALTCNDYKYLLDALMPRNLIQMECKNNLFDTRCTLTAATYAKTAVALSGSSASIVYAAPAAPGGSGSYVRGRMIGTSGANATFQRQIAGWDGASAFTPQQSWAFPVAPGDGFTFYPGCDKSNGSGGCAGFANLPNFRGFPNVPPPEIQIG